MFGLGAFFGSEKAVDNIVNKDNGLLTQVGGWIGSMDYTEQEKSEANAKTREWGIRQLDALAPFKIVQRILAFAVMGMWLMVGLNVLTALWIQAIYPNIIIVKSMLTFAMSDYVFWPVLAVLSLYFTGGVIESARRKKE